MQYSPFIKRVLAAIFDLAIVNLIVFVFGNIMIDALGMTLNEWHMQLMQAGEPLPPGSGTELFISNLISIFLLLSVLSLLAVMVIDVLMLASKRMASPGKQVAGMVVTDLNGKQVSFTRAIARHAAKFISVVSVFGLFMPLWHTQRQALHDVIAKTLVVRKKSLEV